MSDSEDADFFVESWSLPQTTKVKKKFKEGKKDKTLKTRTSETHEKAQDIKTNIKCKKERMERHEKKKKENRQEKKVGNKKEKKKKKHKLALELDGHLTFMQGSCTQTKLEEWSKVANPCQKEKLNTDNLAQDSMKKTKRKKKVAFGLSPTFTCAKHPKFASSSSKDIEGLGEAESCLQATLTGHSQVPAHDDDSQCTGDDINSQDLFITQKKFRASPPESSSSESNERAVTTSLQAFMQKDEDLCTATGERKPCPGESHKPKESQVNISDGRKLPADVKLKVLRPYLDERVGVNYIPAAVSKKHLALCIPPFVNESSLLTRYKVSTFTQTENFFTAELSSYISFCQKSRVTADLQNLRPLDLSLPLRVRRDLCLSTKMSIMDRKNDVEEPHDQETSLLTIESSGQDETTLSSKSGADLTCVDLTASSEDDRPSRPSRPGKRDLIQIKAVQMKLNKPFFFKRKGEGQLPRPESPLMKLSQGRDVKIKKLH